MQETWVETLKYSLDKKLNNIILPHQTSRLYFLEDLNNASNVSNFYTTFYHTVYHNILDTVYTRFFVRTSNLDEAFRCS